MSNFCTQILTKQLDVPSKLGIVSLPNVRCNSKFWLNSLLNPLGLFLLFMLQKYEKVMAEWNSSPKCLYSCKYALNGSLGSATASAKKWGIVGLLEGLLYIWGVFFILVYACLPLLLVSLSTGERGILLWPGSGLRANLFMACNTYFCPLARSFNALIKLWNDNLSSSSLVPFPLSECTPVGSMSEFVSLIEYLQIPDPLCIYPSSY